MNKITRVHYLGSFCSGLTKRDWQDWQTGVGRAPLGKALPWGLPRLDKAPHDGEALPLQTVLPLPVATGTAVGSERREGRPWHAHHFE